MLTTQAQCKNKQQRWLDIMGKKKTKDEFLCDLTQKYQDRFTLLGEYVNSYTKTRFRCNICMDEFDIEPRALLHRGSCSVCAGKKVLYGYNDLETLRSMNENNCKVIKISASWE